MKRILMGGVFIASGIWLINKLMKKSSNDMIKLTSVIETTEDTRGIIKKLMWGNCKACHSKYREEH